ITAGHVVWDVPANYPASPTSPPFAPTNLDRRFYGPVSVREALANQYAAPATRIYSTFSPTAFQQMAERLGLQFAPDTAFPLYITAGHVVWDVPANYPASPTSPPFAPTNLDRRFYGPVSVREALANQYAAPATRIYSTFSPTAFQQMAERMGLQFAPDTAFPL